MRILLALMLMGLGLPVLGQSWVTADDVNDVAERLYCPVCENIPLSDCGTPTCVEWKDEIRLQLEEGRTPQSIIDYFVSRYGQQVVGVPQDPILRFLSFFMPIFGGGFVLIWGVVTFWRWRGGQTRIVHPDVAHDGDDSSYRRIIEGDL